LKHPFVRALTAPDQHDDLKEKKSTTGTELYRLVVAETETETKYCTA